MVATFAASSFPGDTTTSTTVSLSTGGWTTSTESNADPITVSGSVGDTVTISPGDTQWTSTAPEASPNDEEAASTPEDYTMPSATPVAELPDPLVASPAPVPEPAANSDPAASASEAEGAVTKRLSAVFIAGAAGGATVALVVIVLVCVCCVRMRRARRLAGAAIKSGDLDAHVPAERASRFDRRESIPWGHPSPGSR